MLRTEGTKDRSARFGLLAAALAVAAVVACASFVSTASAKQKNRAVATHSGNTKPC